MDDETFKKELLGRLDQIIELLTSALPEACLEEPEPDRMPPVASDAAARAANPTYLIGDELQDDYDCALQKWNRQKPPA